MVWSKKEKKEKQKGMKNYTNEGLIVGVESGSCGSDSASDATSGPRSRGRRHGLAGTWCLGSLCLSVSLDWIGG